MQVHPREAGNRPFDGDQSAGIRTYLDTLLASPGFRLPGRRERLLRYLIERTLAGEGDRINEYSMGVDVFERPADFDPKLDAVVRAEVSRLRQNLKDYYSGPGQADRIIIDLPARSYAPAITFREPPPAPSPAPPDTAPLASAGHRWLGGRFAPGFALVPVAAHPLAGVIQWNTSRRVPAIQSLVVLPFQDLSSNHQSEYLADGL